MSEEPRARNQDSDTQNDAPVEETDEGDEVVEILVNEGADDAALPQQRLVALEDRYLRLAAEFDNYKKRVTREHQKFLLARRDSVIIAWLDVVDSVERALSCSHDRESPLYEGIKRIMDQTKTVLARWNLKPVHSTGQPFDPQCHEAMATVPDPNHPNGTITHTERTGYAFEDGTVLRPARVVVAKNE